MAMYAAIAHAARGDSGVRIAMASSAMIRNVTTTAVHANGVGDQTNPTIGSRTSGSAAVVIRLKVVSGDVAKLISAVRAMRSAMAQKSARKTMTNTTSRKSVTKCAMRRPVTM